MFDMEFVHLHVLRNKTVLKKVQSLFVTGGRRSAFFVLHLLESYPYFCIKH